MMERVGSANFVTEHTSTGGDDEFSGSPSERSRPRFDVCPALGPLDARQTRLRAKARGRCACGRRRGRWGWGESEQDLEPRFAGDRAMLALRRKLSLDPVAVPVPPGLNDGIPIERIALRLCAVACVGALVAWVLTSNVIPAAPPPSTAKPLRNDPTMAAAEPAFAARTVKLISFRVPAEEQPTPAAAVTNAEESARPGAVCLGCVPADGYCVR